MLRRGPLALAAVVLPFAEGPGQEPADTARLGLAASSAFGVHAGAGVLRHASLGPVVGATIDVGSLRTRHLRLVLGVDYLALSLDRVDSLGTRARGRGYVFSAFADVNATTSPTRRVAPYAGIGFGVDAVGSALGNAQIDAIYNTNVFNVHAQVGFHTPITRSGRGALTVELRATGARVVRRVGAHIGYTWLFNDFAPHLRPAARRGGRAGGEPGATAWGAR